MLLLLRVIDPVALAAGGSDRRAGSARHVVGPQTPALIQLPSGIFEIG